jgi:RNA recognition motif-containing protein
MGKILISNVPRDIDEAELASWLQLSGSRIRKIRLIRDEVSLSSPSFAHVEVEEDSVPDLINRLNGQVLRRHSIVVSESPHSRVTRKSPLTSS